MEHAWHTNIVHAYSITTLADSFLEQIHKLVTTTGYKIP